MANETMVLLEKIVVPSGGASSVTFTSIPQSYTDLQILGSARTNRGVYNDSVKLTFNSNTSSYSNRGLGGSGSAVFSFTNAGSASVEDVNFLPGSPATASTFGNGSIYIPNYAGSNNKSLSGDSVGENNATNAGALLNAGLWSNTAAITSITLAPLNGTSFDQYSTFYLYGVAKQGVTPTNAPAATGGDSIVFDGTYWIHTFYSSGTFTPKKALTCDYLVVAGGGGGGYDYAGGGGAGGLRSTVTATGGGGSLPSALSVSANTAYTITVGGGGAGANSGTNNGSQGNSSSISGTGITTVSTTGGGGGGGGNSGTAGNGGSGGGAAAYQTSKSGGTGTANEGYKGGDVNAPTSGPNYRTGGGGGASAAGGDSLTGATSGGNGGAGVATSITGSSVTYAGGGGGGGFSGSPSLTAGSGGAGGGGAGNGGSGGAGTAGTANTGGGGGGGAGNGGNGGTGGSGIVIVRYAA